MFTETRTNPTQSIGHMSSQKARVLIVDDEPNQREMLRDILVAEGFEALTAPGGPEALMMVAEHKPAVILSDLKMPGMDGLELLTRVRQSNPTTAFMVMTAYPDFEKQDEAFRRGALVYFIKPIDIERLIRELLRALNG